MVFPDGSSSKEFSDRNAGDTGDVSSVPTWEDPWRRKWSPTPVFLPGKSHEQRSLPGYSPYGCKEWDTNEHARSYPVD